MKTFFGYRLINNVLFINVFEFFTLPTKLIPLPLTPNVYKYILPEQPTLTADLNNSLILSLEPINKLYENT